MPATATSDGSSTDIDEVRQRILDAAQLVFAERGYAGATTREIADRAGIAKRMLFYYFVNKDAVYRGVLERVVGGLVHIHAEFRQNPGPIGLGEAVEAMTLFAAQNLPAVRVWMREIIDGGPHLAELVRQYVAPVYQLAGEEVARNMRAGVFRASDPMHVLVNVGGLTLFYFLILPMLPLVWDKDPLAPEVLAERAAVTRTMLMLGLAGSAAPGEAV
jgi:TetR/AcrR family transcriptional regulator